MNSSQGDPPPSARLGREVLRGLALLWLVLFSIQFFRQPLPNSQPSVTRRDVWAEVPALLLDCIVPDTSIGALPSGWRYFPQRWDLILTAAVVACGAWHLGGLFLRLLELLGGTLFAKDRAGRFAASGLLGFAAWSLLTLTAGLAGRMHQQEFLIALAVFTVVEQLFRWRDRSTIDSGPRIPLMQRRFLTGSFLGPACILIVAPFVAAMLLGAMLPSTDFDVKAYHLVGPKQWFREGQMTFLPNNVYTNFPFLAEMLCLSTMIVRHDWFRGAIAGQLVLACFAPLAAAAIFSTTKRFFSERAAWLAVVVYLTTPWVYRISIIAYVEGPLAAYLVATLGAFLHASLARPRTEDNGSSSTNAGLLLCGLFAGSAAACKYPGVITAVIPIGVGLLFHARRSQSGVLRAAGMYTTGVLVSFGPWLLKNLLLTGNPVFPLLWKVFGGRSMDAALAAKFDAGHPLPVEMLSSPARWFPDLWAHLRDVAMMSDWQSALVFGLAPASLLVLPRRATVEEDDGTSVRPALGTIWLYAAWLFFAWWALTHRIDRFWVPMLSVLAILAGVGADQLLNSVARPWKYVASLVVVAVGLTCVVFNLGMITSRLSGFNGYLLDEKIAVSQATTDSMVLLNDSAPSDSRTLLIGDAEIFDARRDVIAHSVFNHSLFELWFSVKSPTSELTLRPADEILKELHDRHVTHVFVNWLEILRYRTTYGYSEFVSPERFRELVEAGVLKEVPLPLTRVATDAKLQDNARRALLNEWDAGFLRKDGETEWFPAYQLFEVR